MGLILSKFRRKKPSSKDRLEEIDKELRSIQRFQVDTELQQKRIIGRLILFSALLYLASAAAAYFFSPSGLKWTDRAKYIIPFVVFPVILWALKRVVTMFYERRITKKRELYDELKKEKQRILEDVMDNETFKVGKEILEKYAPGKLLPKHMEQYASMPSLSPLASPSGPLAQARGQGMMSTPTSRQGYNEGLRRRTLPAQGFAPNAMSTPVRPMQQQIRPGPGYNNIPSNSDMRGPRFGPMQFSRQPTNYINRPVLAITASPSPYSPMSVRFRPAQQPMPTFMLPLPPSNPVVQNRSLGWMDKLVEYVVGDGPSNRYALICRYCATHNGLATPEEFPYIGFRCVYCKQYNPAKQARPAAPKLPTNTVLIEELESTVKSESQIAANTDSETESNENGNKSKQETASEPVITEFEAKNESGDETERIFVETHEDKTNELDERVKTENVEYIDSDGKTGVVSSDEKNIGSEGDNVNIGSGEEIPAEDKPSEERG